MIEYEDKINNIRTYLLKKKFQNELDIAYNDEFIVNDDRYHAVKKTLENLDNKIETVTQLNNFFDVINKDAFNKKWHLLTKFHQKIKIDEYLKSLSSDEKIQKKMYNKLIPFIQNNTLKKHITYNSVEKRIETIKNLSFDETTNKITIN